MTLLLPVLIIVPQSLPPNAYLLSILTRGHLPHSLLPWSLGLLFLLYLLCKLRIKSTSSFIMRPFARRKIDKTPLREIKAPLSTEELDHILVHGELLFGILDEGQDFLYIAFQSIPIKWYSPGNHPFRNFMKACQNKRFIPRPCQLAE